MANSVINFGIVIHNHQPVGNFPWVLEQTYSQAYLPMLEAMERHSSLNFCLHYSGALMDWLKENHLDFVPRLASLVQKGQVEIVSGGYYEPILPAIPDADKLGQIAKMNSFIRQKFNQEPSGFWLAERVWEPYLAKILAQAEIDWTLVDDTHFKWTGLEDEDLRGYYITEDVGHIVKIFPISKHLRYAIPWHTVDEVIEFFRREASTQSHKIIVLGDDGEKFGVWPGTCNHCWQGKWVDNFLTALEDNQSWLRTVKLSDYVLKHPPQGRIYLPCASYEEMAEWALPADKARQYTQIKHELEKGGRQDIAQFLRGGFWRHFLVKYPEANNLYCKMLRVHEKVYRALALRQDDTGQNELWQAQCNEPYWHGIFGGIYLADLRANAYHHLIEAEIKAEKVLSESQLQIASVKNKVKWEKTDFNNDGAEEVLIESQASALYLTPQNGGAILEWDSRGYCHNLLSSLARRPEAYHQILSEGNQGKMASPSVSEVSSIHDLIRIKDSNLSQRLVYDRYPRYSLLDHFFNKDAGREDFSNGEYQERGDFVTGPYEVSLNDVGDKLHIQLRRQGECLQNEVCLPLEINKLITVTADETSLLVNINLKNISPAAIEGVYGSEWNFNLLGGGHNDSAYYQVADRKLSDCHLDSWGELKLIRQLAMVNKNLGFEIEVKTTPEVDLWYFPVETVSNSETGMEKLYQASCLVFLLPFRLLPGASASLKLNWSVKP